MKLYYGFSYIFCPVIIEIKPNIILLCSLLKFKKLSNIIIQIEFCPSKFEVIYVLLICIYFTKKILEAFYLENIKIKFNEDGPSLEAILIQFAKFKLNSVRLDFFDSDFIELLNIDK